MTIELKFDIDQTVWFIHNNKVEIGVIEKVAYVGKNTGEKFKRYQVRDVFERMDKPRVFTEDELFSTKEELVAAILIS